MTILHAALHCPLWAQLPIVDQVPFLCDLDTLSTIYICAKLRYVVQKPVEEEVDGSRSNFIMREGDIVSRSALFLPLKLFNNVAMRSECNAWLWSCDRMIG